jgi:hypothetical protein
MRDMEILRGMKGIYPLDAGEPPGDARVLTNRHAACHAADFPNLSMISSTPAVFDVSLEFGL